MMTREIRLEHLFTVRFDVSAPRPLGKTPFGERRIVQITGGSFEGGDWILLRDDGALQLDVRATLQTEDGALLYMTYRGFRHGPEDVMKRLAAGEAVDPASYYFRTAPFFETGAENYAWLNRTITIATGERRPSGPIYRVYEVL
jgi:hypothetical protein